MKLRPDTGDPNSYPLEFSENGIPLVSSVEDKKVESGQFKELLRHMDKEEALRIYNSIKTLEHGEFEKSQLRDENGELCIVWHGSPRRFEKFQADLKGEFRWINEGIHFSSSEKVVEQYADKAYSALRVVLYTIASQLFQLEEGKSLTSEQIQRAKEEYNKLIEEVREKGEQSASYKKEYASKGGAKSEERDPSGDYLAYGKARLGVEWVSEIFGGKLPTKENSILDAGENVYIGKDIGRYFYAAVLDIEKPFRAEIKNIDRGFSLGEESRKIGGTDGNILSHPEGVIGMGGLLVSGTVGTISAAVFDEKKIKILGCDAGGKFEVSRELL